MLMNHFNIEFSGAFKLHSKIIYFIFMPIKGASNNYVDTQLGSNIKIHGGK